MKPLLRIVPCAVLMLPLFAINLACADESPFNYLLGEAHHIMPETHNRQSGYFSLSEGPNGRIYVGTAKYGVNAYLVEYDPQTSQQRIVVDAHETAGIEATGMASQAKFHTRNHVAESGRIYLGTKQGYPDTKKGEKPLDYRGGYLMRYDPHNDTAENLGKVPFIGYGVSDIIADEQRNLLYMILHRDATRGTLWMRRNIEGENVDATWQGLHDRPSFYGQTLMDHRGHAHMVTIEGTLVSYDPDSDVVQERPLKVNGETFTAPDHTRSPPTWVVDPDGRMAYMIFMTEPTLYRLDLTATGDEVVLEDLGKTIDVERIDSRCAMSFGPDGNVYVLVRRDNDTGFGSGRVHHLVRFSPSSEELADLGIVGAREDAFTGYEAIEPDQRYPHAHRFNRLPDGTFAAGSVHLAMIVTEAGDVYATFLSPFTLLRIDGVATPQ